MDKINVISLLILFNIFYCTRSQLCDVRQWYRQCVRHGLFDGPLSPEQITIRDQIERLIMESSTDRRKNKIDCLLLDEYEEMLENKPLEAELENPIPTSETEVDETDITDDSETGDTGDAYLNEEDSNNSWNSQTQGNEEIGDIGAAASRHDEEDKYENIEGKVDENAPNVIHKYDSQAKQSIQTEIDNGAKEEPVNPDTAHGAQTIQGQMRNTGNNEMAVDTSRDVRIDNEQLKQIQNDIIEQVPKNFQKEIENTQMNEDQTANRDQNVNTKPTKANGDEIEPPLRDTKSANEDQKETHSETKNKEIVNTLSEKRNNEQQTEKQTHPSNMKLDALESERRLEQLGETNNQILHDNQGIQEKDLINSDEQRQGLDIASDANLEQQRGGKEVKTTSDQLIFNKNHKIHPLGDLNSDTISGNEVERLNIAKRDKLSVQETNNENKLKDNQIIKPEMRSNEERSTSLEQLNEKSNDQNVKTDDKSSQFQDNVPKKESGAAIDGKANAIHEHSNIKSAQINSNVGEETNPKSESDERNIRGRIANQYQNFCICNINQCTISDIFIMKYIAPITAKPALKRSIQSEPTASDNIKNKRDINENYIRVSNNQMTNDQIFSTNRINNDLSNEEDNTESMLPGNNIVSNDRGLKNNRLLPDTESEDRGHLNTDARPQRPTNAGLSESMVKTESKTGDLQDKLKDSSKTLDMKVINENHETIRISNELENSNELRNTKDNRIEPNEPLDTTKHQNHMPQKEDNTQTLESFPSPGRPLTTTEDKETKEELRREESTNFRKEYETLKSQVEQDKQNIILKIDNMLQTKTHEYSSKIQSLEILIMKLENQLLMEKFDKHNHSSTITRLESGILKLENELLKLNQSHNDLKMENEYLNKKRKSYLELDHVSPNISSKVSDQSIKNTAIISEQQSKIFQLMELLKNQSKAIHHFKSKFEYLEDQNRMLFQMVMNQTSLMTQIMSRVQDLSDQNMQHRVEAQMLREKLALSKMSEEKDFQELTKVSSKLMDKLDAIVSDNKLDMIENGKPNTSVTKNEDVKHERIDESEEKLEAYIRKTKQLANATQNWCGGHNMVCIYKSIRLSSCVPFVPVFWSVCEAASKVDTLPKMEFVYDKRNVKKATSKRMESKDENKDMSGNSKEGAFVQESEDNIVHVAAQDDTMETINNEHTNHEDGNNQSDLKTPEQPPINDAETRAQQQIITNQPEQEVPGNTIQYKAQQGEAEVTKEKDNAEFKETKQDKITDDEFQTSEKRNSDQVIRQNVKTEDHGTFKQLDKNNHVNDAVVKKEKQRKQVQSVQDSQPRKNAKAAPKPKAKEKHVKENVEDKYVDKSHKKQNSGAEEVGKKKQSVKQEKPIDNIRNRELRYEKGSQKDPKDCYDYYISGNKKNSIYKIKPYGLKKTIQVRCDMRNGGWTIIQQRSDGTTKFFRDWNEYKSGFGGVFGEHWLGNDYIHYLTNQDNYELRIELTDWNKTKKYAEYKHFSIDDEKEGYKLTIAGYSGTAGDGMAKHNGHKFSTRDVDNDKVEKEFGGSCAKRFSGAWWYYKCYMSNLNGLYYRNGQIPPKLFDGITWKPWTGPNYSLRSVEMKIRPVSAKDK